MYPSPPNDETETDPPPSNGAIFKVSFGVDHINPTTISKCLPCITRRPGSLQMLIVCFAPPHPVKLLSVTPFYRCENWGPRVIKVPNAHTRSKRHRQQSPLLTVTGLQTAKRKDRAHQGTPWWTITPSHLPPAQLWAVSEPGRKPWPGQGRF